MFDCLHKLIRSDISEPVAHLLDQSFPFTLSCPDLPASDRNGLIVPLHRFHWRWALPFTGDRILWCWRLFPPVDQRFLEPGRFLLLDFPDLTGCETLTFVRVIRASLLIRVSRACRILILFRLHVVLREGLLDPVFLLLGWE